MHCSYWFSTTSAACCCCKILSLSCNLEGGGRVGGKGEGGGETSNKHYWVQYDEDEAGVRAATQPLILRGHHV